MQDMSTSDRAVYQPSGKINWARLLPGALVAAVAAFVMAGCLYFAFEKGAYLVFVAPILASLPVVGIWYLVLSWSHCRSKRIATVGSVGLALLLYLGYYYFGLLHMVGIQNAHRVDLWPQYVQLRMKTDVARDPRFQQAAGPQKNGPVEEGFNWFFFGTELVVLVGLFAGAGRTCVSRAYCEPCGKWMERETLKLPPGQGTALWNSMQRRDDANVRRLLASTSRKESAAGVLTVERCPTCPHEGRPAAVFLTVRDIPVPGTRVPIQSKVASLFKPRPVANLRSVASHVALDPEEVIVLARAFPTLKATIDAQPDLFPEADSDLLEIADDDSQPEEWKGRPAIVQPVEPADAGRVLTRTNALLQTVIAVITTFGGILLGLGPLLVVTNLAVKPPEWVAAVAGCWMFGFIGLHLLFLLYFPSYLTTRFMLGQTRRAFQGRLNPALDVQDPDLVFVDIIPPLNRGKRMMENASDIGFLKFDKSRRELIFEGDRERYWIPVESILETRHDYWADAVKHQLQRSPNLNHVILVRAMTAKGPWETWFYRRHNGFRPRTANRRLNDALELQRSITEFADAR